MLWRIFLLVVLADFCRICFQKDSTSKHRHASTRIKPLRSSTKNNFRINSSTSGKSRKLPRNLNDFTFDSANLTHDRNLIVHLHEWKWKDVAKECKTYLAPNGFGAVQVSPPMAHLFNVEWINGREDVSWYVRYQPTSYSLNSRSGTEAEFIQMVEECNGAGVRIIVDTILNHMAHVSLSFDGNNPKASLRSTDGSPFHGQERKEKFPNPGYYAQHFNDGKCDGDVNNYNDRYNVQYCRLCGLTDLDQGHPEVQSMLITYMNRLIDIGVMGFRLDASKHMPAHELAQILPRLKYLNAKYFGEGRDPFIFHEVISYPHEAVQSDEYANLGRVKNFQYGRQVTDAIRNWDYKNAWDLIRIHEYTHYGNMAGHQMLTFLDNHDNQRYETDGHITHKQEWDYRLASAFMLAHTYGVPRLMSSYIFHHTNQGPPHNGGPNFETKSPTFNEGGCGNGWACEHRWPEIRRMAKWRSEMGGAAMALIHYEHGNCFGFARLDRGYFAFNNDRNHECVLNDVDTSLAAGTYCNVFAEDFQGNCKPEHQITVSREGKATIRIYKSFAVVFGVSSKIEETNAKQQTFSRASSKRRRVKRRAPSVRSKTISKKTSVSLPLGTLPDNSLPTIIFMKKDTIFGRHVFLRGGRAGEDDCHMRANKWNKCAIPIKHLLDVGKDEPNIIYEHFSMWSQHDDFLDFHGGEHSQGTVSAGLAQGTPMICTTKDRDSTIYNSLTEKYELEGNYWLVVLDIDCGQDPSFAVKGFVKEEQFEPGANHIVQCGKVNILQWGHGDNRVI